MIVLLTVTFQFTMTVLSIDDINDYHDCKSSIDISVHYDCPVNSNFPVYNDCPVIIAVLLTKTLQYFRQSSLLKKFIIIITCILPLAVL